MVSRLHNITVDCHNHEALGAFWAEVLGWPDDPKNPNAPGDPEWYLAPPAGGPGMLFIPVPEGKTVKNRLHLDVTPQDRTRDEEVERLLALGARLVDDHRKPDGTGWAVLADPEGNEFCVERSDAERARRSE